MLQAGGSVVGWFSSRQVESWTGVCWRVVALWDVLPGVASVVGWCCCQVLVLWAVVAGGSLWCGLVLLLGGASVLG